MQLKCAGIVRWENISNATSLLVEVSVAKAVILQNGKCKFKNNVIQNEHLVKTTGLLIRNQWLYFLLFPSQPLHKLNAEKNDMYCHLQTLTNISRSPLLFSIFLWSAEPINKFVSSPSHRWETLNIRPFLFGVWTVFYLYTSYWSGYQSFSSSPWFPRRLGLQEVRKSSYSCNFYLNNMSKILHTISINSKNQCKFVVRDGNEATEHLRKQHYNRVSQNSGLQNRLHRSETRIYF